MSTLSALLDVALPKVKDSYRVMRDHLTIGEFAILPRDVQPECGNQKWGKMCAPDPHHLTSGFITKEECLKMGILPVGFDPHDHVLTVMFELPVSEAELREIELYFFYRLQKPLEISRGLRHHREFVGQTNFISALEMRYPAE